MSEMLTVFIVGTAGITLITVGGYIAFRRWMSSEDRKAERFREIHRR